MPDYGTTSGSGTGASSTYKGGSGYTAPSLNKSGSKASQRRKKLAKQLAAQTAAYEKQKATDAAAAAKATAAKAAAANKFRQEEAQRANMAGAAAAQQEAARQAAAAQAAAQTTFGQQAAANQQAAQQAAARRAAAAQAAAAAAAREANVGYGYTPAPASSSSSNRTSTSTQNANQKAAESLLGAGYRNVKGDKNKSTLYQQFMSGIRNLMNGEGLPGDNPLKATPVTTDGPSTRLGTDTTIPPKPDITGDPFRPPPDLPPEIVDPFRPPVYPPVMPPQFPQYPGYGGGMMGGIGAFGYNPALMAFESQQGAGQVPYYMAAARNAQTPNMSPAFMHAARNYDILGGSQRTAPRPMEMMSSAERAQIAGMSNFSTPNYNSPYDQFNFFSNMVGGGGGGGKGMGRSAPQMAGGLGAFYGGFG